MPAKVLEQVMQVRGVQRAALFDEGGQLIEALGGAPDAAVVSAGRAIAASLRGAVGGGDLRDLVIDFEDGPVLLTALGERTLLTAFDDVANLGRLRYAVKRAVQAEARPPSSSAG